MPGNVEIRVVGEYDGWGRIESFRKIKDLWLKRVKDDHLDTKSEY